MWKALMEHQSLTALDMSWNSIGQRLGEGSVPAVNGPMEGGSENRPSSPKKAKKEKGSDVPPVVDLRHRSRSPAEVLGSLLSVNSVLLHLSISKNKFTAEDMSIIGESYYSR